MDQINQIRIAPRQVGERHFDSITACIGGLRLSCDLTCDREIRLAKHLADEHGADFIVHPDLAVRVNAAINHA